MKKILNKYSIVLGCVLIVVVLALPFIFKLSNAKAETMPEKITYLTEEKYSITNTKIHNGVSITDYATSRYGNSVMVDFSKYKLISIFGNDEIVNIVPEELFKTPGKTLHIGKAYGFYIECRKPLKSSDVLLSTVMIIDLTYNDRMNDPGKESHLVFQFAPIFQADFAYVRRTDDKTYSLDDQTYDFLDEKYLCDVSLDFATLGDEFIIPVPTVTFPHYLASPELSLLQHQKYYLVDPSSQLSLLNVNEWNVGDYRYNYINDGGAFISQTDYFCQAMYLKNGTVDWAQSGDILFNTIAYGYDIIDSTNLYKFTSLLKYFPVVDKIYTTIDLIKSIKDVQSDFKYSGAWLNKEETYTGYYTNAEKQKNEYNCLLTNAAIASTFNGNNLNLLYGNNAWGKFDYQICVQSLSKDTRYHVSFNFGVVGITAKNKFEVNISDVFYSTSVFANNLQFANDITYKEILKINAVDGEANFESHILPNYYNLVEFIPDESGYYDIKGNYLRGGNSRLGISVYEISGNHGYDNLTDPIRMSSDGKVEHVWLESGKTYYVKSDLKAGANSDGFYYGEFSLNFYKAKQLQVGSNEITFYDDCAYVKVHADSNQYFCVQAPDCMIDIVDHNFNVIGGEPIGGTVLNNGDEQYYRITRPADTVESVIATLTTKRHIIFNPDNGKDDMELWIINSNYPTLPEPGLKTGYQYLGWVEPDREDYHYNQTSIKFLDKAEIILKADWAKKYRVHYETNGGSLLADGEFNEKQVAVLHPGPVKQGYVFMGWYDNPELTGEKLDELPIGTNTDITLYAGWKPKSVVITYDFGNGKVVKEVHEYNETIYTLSATKDFHRGVWRSSFGYSVQIGMPYTCKDTDERFYLQWEVISPYTEKTYVRNSTYTITDSGVFNQNYDNVFSFTKGQANIYSKVKIVIQFTAWEKDDGYQHVMIYDGSGTGATLLGEKQFEHGGSKKDTNPADYEFVFEVDMSKLANKDLCIRYSASGFGSDTWYNNAMTCSVTYYE